MHWKLINTSLLQIKSVNTFFYYKQNLYCAEYLGYSNSITNKGALLKPFGAKIQREKDPISKKSTSKRAKIFTKPENQLPYPF